MIHYRKGLRTIAIYEAAKGTIVILTGVGLLRSIDHDLQKTGERLVHFMHLNPASHYPKIFLQALENVSSSELRWLALGAFVYSVFRFVEAYGLWKERAWAEWLAIVATAIYLPVEVYELVRKPSWLKVGLIAINLLLLGYLIYVRRRQKVTKNQTETPPQNP